MQCRFSIFYGLRQQQRRNYTFIFIIGAKTKANFCCYSVRAKTDLCNSKNKKKGGGGKLRKPGTAEYVDNMENEMHVLKKKSVY